MATVRATYKDFADLPEGLRDFLLSDASVKKDEELQKAYGLNDDEVATIGDAVMDAVSNDVSLSEAILRLKSAFLPTRISNEKWKSFLSDFCALGNLVDSRCIW